MNEQSKPTVVAIYLSKGGVAKSTIAALLAVYLAGAGYRVALFDLDRQGTQSDIFDLVNDDGSYNEVLHAILKRRVDALAALTEVHGEWPGVLAVVQGGALTPLAVDEIKNNPYQFRITNTSALVSDPIRDLAGHMDFVVLDMGPSDQVLSIGGLNAADYLLMPTDTGRSSVLRIGYALEEVEIARANNPKLEVIGIVPVKTRKYFGGIRVAKSVQVARDVLCEAYGDLLLRDSSGPIELEFNEDWEVVRWAGEYDLLKADYVKDKVKNNARRFLNAVLDHMGVPHA